MQRCKSAAAIRLFSCLFVAALVLVGGISAYSETPAPQAKAPTANAFDPSGYIAKQAVGKAEKAVKLTNWSIYRLNGQRFHRFDSADGAVFLPGAGTMPELHEEFAVCAGELDALDEVLPVRQHVPFTSELKKHEAAIVAMIRKCQEQGVGRRFANGDPRTAGTADKAFDIKVKPAAASDRPSAESKTSSAAPTNREKGGLDGRR